MKARSVYLHLRQHGRTLLVLQVHSFDFFRLGLTEVHATAPILAHLKGRQFGSLGHAAQEIHVEVFGRGAGYSNYMREYEAYCVPIGRCDEHWVSHLGKGTRVVVSHGEKFESSYSPDLLNQYVELAPDSLAPSGRWITCGDLLPLVPLSVPDTEATARLVRELEQNRQNPTIGSRNRQPGKNASAGSSSTHATASSSRRDDQDHWRCSGRAQVNGAPAGQRYHSSAHASEHAQVPASSADTFLGSIPYELDRVANRPLELGHATRPAHATDTPPDPSEHPVEPRPKRARFSTKDGLCVYRRVGDTHTPHEIVSHWLVEQAVPGQASMKMLRLRPLHPPGAGTLDVPCVETASLHERFKTEWTEACCDAVSGESTGRTDSNSAIYDAHIRAVKLQAKVVEKSERNMFHQLRWGHGNIAYSPPPPELEADEPHLAASAR